MNKQTGFSLLEILVAFSILAISLGILLKIFSSGVNTAMIAEEYTIATQIAESLMAKTGVEEELTIGNTTGIELDKYHWQINIESSPNPIVEEQKSSIDLMAVKVSVEWGDGEHSRLVELNTLKTK